MASRSPLCVCLVALFCGMCLVAAPVQGQWVYVHDNEYVTNNTLLESAIVSGGVLWNCATINSAAVSGGELYNYDTIRSADVRGGELQNRYDGVIESATVYSGGTLYNRFDAGFGPATIDALILCGGTVISNSSIREMTYLAGTYTGGFGGTDGSIGTLTVAGPVTGGDWRNVGKLVFDSNGTGAITVTAAASASNGLGVSFRSAITASSIDFTHGTILLDLTAIVRDGEDWISAVSGLFESGMTLATLFGVSDSGPNSTITGLDALDSLKVLWGDNQPGTILDGGKLAPGWESTGVAGGGFTHNTPEPATLTLLCLSTAALLRRRRK